MKNSKLYLVNSLLATLVTPMALLALSFKIARLIAIKEQIPIDDRIRIYRSFNTISLKVFIISVLFAIVTMLINNIFEEKKFKIGQIIMTVLLVVLMIALIIISIILNTN